MPNACIVQARVELQAKPSWLLGDLKTYLCWFDLADLTELEAALEEALEERICAVKLRTEWWCGRAGCPMARPAFNGSFRPTSCGNDAYYSWAASKEAALMNATQLRAQLAHFTGSATFTRNGMVRSVVMTEGVMFLAEAAGAHWLADAIASYLHDDRARREEFQAWRLVVDSTTRQAVLSMTDGNSDVPIITQALDYTDFPLDEITLWLIASGDHRVLMLPSEY